jgi:hypothetical protein
MKKYIIFIITGLVIITALIFCLYFSKFNNGFSDNNADWGSFGGYIAGTVGICFSFFTLFLIFQTFKIQRKALLENTFQQLVLNYNSLINLIHENWLHKRDDYRNGREIFGNAIALIGGQLEELSTPELKKEFSDLSNECETFKKIYYKHINVFQHYFGYILETISIIQKNNDLKPNEKNDYYRRFSSLLSFFELAMLAYFIDFKEQKPEIHEIIKSHFLFRLNNLEEIAGLEPHSKALKHILSKLHIIQ